MPLRKWENISVKISDFPVWMPESADRGCKGSARMHPVLPIIV